MGLAADRQTDRQTQAEVHHSVRLRAESRDTFYNY